MTRHRSAPALTAAIAAVAILLTACSDGAALRPSADGTPLTSSPTDWTPLTDDSPDVLPVGRYGLTVAENVVPDLPRAVVDVPEGFGHFRSWIVARERAGALSYWTVHAVYVDPCKADVIEVDTVEEAAVALRDQRRSIVTAPRPVTLDGYQGLHLELEVPEETDFTVCPRYRTWDIDAAGGLPYWQSPGRQMLWILDVDGEVVILDASADSDVPRSAHTQLAGMVQSVDFVRWP